MSPQTEKDVPKEAAGGAAKAAVEEAVKDTPRGMTEEAPARSGGKAVGKGRGNEQGRRMALARRFTLAAVLAAVLVSLAFDSGLGTPSSFGIGEFFLLCPLGGIEAMVASGSFIPIAALSMAVVIAFALVFGRAWCAWGCPAPAIRTFFRRNLSDFGGTGTASASGRSANAASSGPPPLPYSPESLRSAGGGGDFSGDAAGGRRSGGLAGALRRIGRDGRTWVLVAVVVAAFVAGFPLFCLVCPVGLTFGTVGSLWHLIVDKQVTLSLVVFPVALLVELVLYRKWCMNLCPIAGLLGVAGQFARLFRPRINAATCLRYHAGADCSVCTSACSERIDLHAADAREQLGECTRCGECARQCPTASIVLAAAPADPVVREYGGTRS